MAPHPQTSFLGRPIVLLCAVTVSFLSIAPYAARQLHPLNQGLTVIRDKDYANYDSRLERALSGHPSEAGNGITPVGSGIEGMQVAGVEVVLGTLFAWTGIPAPPLSAIITAILGPILFLLFYQLFRFLSFPDRWSLAMTLVLFVVMFHGLTRVVHPGWSFVPSIAALIAFIVFHKRPTVIRAVTAGVLLGVLPFLYFWSWMFVWASAGSLVILGMLAHRSHEPVIRQWKLSFLLAIIVAIVAIPFALHTIDLFQNPLYGEVAVRASFLSQRTPESWPRTILLLVQLAALLSLFPRSRSDRSYLAVAAMLLGLTLAMHQNVLHNRVLMFASHFEPHMIIASMTAGAWALWRRAPVLRRVVIAGIALVFLVAGASDYAFAHRFFLVRESDFHDQYLAPAIALLAPRHREVILTDANTGRLLTAWTSNAIVYTTHARFLLISDAAMAERFCVAEMFDPAPNPFRSLYIEYNRVLDSPAMRRHEADLVNEACARVKADPAAMLTKYGVTAILWNRSDHPEWTVESDAPKLGLWKRASGSGWELWENGKLRIEN